MAQNQKPAVFTGQFTDLPDLAAESVGGKILFVTDEFFAPCENLLKSGRGVWIEGKFTEFGKWMDGWESRRKRTPGHDWCIIKLGLPGNIKGVDIDTNHFTGNYPAFASLEAVHCDDDNLVTQLPNSAWQEILPQSQLGPSSQHLLPITVPAKEKQPWTHLRFHIFPDGGVARLRVYGDVIQNWSKIASNAVVDLAAVENGGLAIACSDQHYGGMKNINLPGRGLNMGDGWETRRRRGLGFDWIIIKLGHKGYIDEVEIDTHYFKGNFPDSCIVEAACLNESGLVAAHVSLDFKKILSKQKLKAHESHVFGKDQLKCDDKTPFTHVRVRIIPDGGLMRVRVRGRKCDE